MDTGKAKVVLSMDVKGEEITRAFEKAIGKMPKVQSTPGKPGEMLSKNEGDQDWTRM